MSGKLEGHKGPGHFSFHGRAGRGEWLWSMIISTVLGSMIAVGLPGMGAILSAPFTLALLAASTRRLHDIKLSGWFQVIPIVGMGATTGLFYAFQHFGIVDYRRVLGLAALNATEFNTEPTLNELLAIPGKLEDIGQLTLLETVPVAAYFIATFAILILYGVMLLVPGTNGSNCYGEADRR